MTDYGKDLFHRLYRTIDKYLLEKQDEGATDVIIEVNQAVVNIHASVINTAADYACRNQSDTDFTLDEIFGVLVEAHLEDLKKVADLQRETVADNVIPFVPRG